MKTRLGCRRTLSRTPSTRHKTNKPVSTCAFHNQSSIMATETTPRAFTQLVALAVATPVHFKPLKETENCRRNHNENYFHFGVKIYARLSHQIIQLFTNSRNKRKHNCVLSMKSERVNSRNN